MQAHQPQVRIIGTNGQISLGKEFAGKMVLVDQVESGTWIIKCGEFIPDSEKWLYQGDNVSRLKKAIEWATKNKPSENFDAVIKRIERDIDNN